MAFRSYFLCATPRSGSTLLCDLLTETGIAGRPASYFREEDVAHWSRCLEVPVGNKPRDYGPAYLEAVVAHGSAGTDVFGCRVMWTSLSWLSERLDRLQPGPTSAAARIARVFGPTLYVHLTRADKVAQAVSLLRALQSGLWHRKSDGTPREAADRSQPTSYDEACLATLVEELEHDDESWTSWFAANDIVPLVLSYDALVADPRSAVADILSALGLDRTPAAHVAPRTARLADDESRDWVRRFRRGKRSAGS